MSVPTGNRTHLPPGGLLLMILLSASLTGCGEEAATAPAPAVETPEPPPVEEGTAEEPEPEPEPDPVQTAMEEGRFEVVCEALASEGFSDHVCAFLMARARGERGSLNQRTLERFLRGQQVRRVRGRIVEVYETGVGSVTYEARIGGRTSLLETTETTFTTTGAFSMWAQHSEDEEMVLTSGRVREIRVYTEWKLADDLLDLARQRSGGEATARRMLDELILDWTLQWRHPDFEVPEEPAETYGPSEERRQECRRYCFEYRDCMRDMGSHAACEVNINRRCRACREEGAHR